MVIIYEFPTTALLFLSSQIGILGTTIEQESNALQKGIFGVRAFVDLIGFFLML
jgi:hypothetical protein